MYYKARSYAKPRKCLWYRNEELYQLRIKNIFGQKILTDINRQNVQSFHIVLREEGLAAATCNHHIGALRHCFNLAIDWGCVETNPVSRVPLFHEGNKIEHYLTDEELGRLLKVLCNDANRSVCMIALFPLIADCRLNEAFSARWSDVYLEKSVFIVRAQNSKRKRLQAVPLNDSTWEVLKKLGTQAYLYIIKQT